jgi:hypothetical protein
MCLHETCKIMLEKKIIYIGDKKVSALHKEEEYIHTYV